MELNEFEQNDKLIRARNKVKELKGFYIHLIVYILVNAFIATTVTVARMSGGESFTEAFFNVGTLSTPIFWGIGLAFHAAKVYGFSVFFSKDWEERQIRKYVEKDKQDADRYL
ncbi:2TM domain-containing protein [Maribacter sp. LLG6340-A2]|uniref:2TM domain-containing protein n=1 Tax=Maribacter sp. LLG6340-A2 TaxID=3160834 RepID=UPI00386AC1DB